MPKVSKYLLPITASIRDAVNTIDRTGRGIVLIVNSEGQLIGTVTDGDVRVAVLNQIDLDAPVQVLLDRQKNLPFKTPITAFSEETHEEVVAKMDRFNIRHIPIIDSDHRPLDIALKDCLIEEEKPHMRALIMAGGLGTRLSPLTNTVPKPMVKIDEKPILQHIIEHLRRSGITELYISVRYRKEQIIEYFGNGEAWGVSIQYFEETSPLGTGGALRFLPDFEGNTLVINGDILTDLNYSLFECFHDKNNAGITVGVRNFEVQVPFGVVDISGVEISRFKEKPKFFYFINAGIYILSPAAFQCLPASECFNMNDLIDALMNISGKVVSFPICGYWSDVGTIADYEKAQECFKKKLHRLMIDPDPDLDAL